MYSSASNFNANTQHPIINRHNGLPPHEQTKTYVPAVPGSVLEAAGVKPPSEIAPGHDVPSAKAVITTMNAADPTAFSHFVYEFPDEAAKVSNPSRN